MTIKQPFMPQYGSNQVITVGATAAVGVNKDSRQVRVVNTGAALGYFRTFSTSSAASSAATGQATAADCPVPAGMSTTVTKGGDHDRLATFSATGTTFQVMTGEGF